ncbi:ubiquinol-cytochrome c reductase, iron-sulfur subunit [gamma proteobacterium HTCC5015]|nr:ubiquinol-cytochrome c reductase, iron-sulfur subunit [gamma proteobacterium HTCC5015]
MSNDVNQSRRRFLTATTAVVGGAGAAAAAVPFVASMSPSARARAAGAPVEADISKLEAGRRVTFKWRGKPVWIVNRTDKMLADMKTLEGTLADPNSEAPQQPEYTQNGTRSIKDKYLVLVGLCTHLGCSPQFRPEVAAEDLGADWKGGFFCPCHGSKFDLAGRVYAGVPAPTNMVIPPHYYIDDNTILIGEDGGNA